MYSVKLKQLVHNWLAKACLAALVALSVLWWLWLAPQTGSLLALLALWMIYIALQLERSGYGPENKL
jgi:uncharacterized membrane protein